MARVLLACALPESKEDAEGPRRSKLAGPRRSTSPVRRSKFAVRSSKFACMKSPKSVFVCQSCGGESQKWLGRCGDCGAWNSYVEEKVSAVSERRGAAAPLGGGTSRLYEAVDTVVSERLSSGVSEFDRVLGGGLVPGSLVLLGGEPGIGKSTLLLQAAAHFATHIGPVLYCSGEESEHQIKLRGERLGVGGGPLYLLAETCVERLIDEVERLKP